MGMDMDMRLSPFWPAAAKCARAKGEFEFQPKFNQAKVDLYDNHETQLDSPKLMTSGAFSISNNMAASTASSSGLMTPISELPPSIMGEGDMANGDSLQQLPMDYFDFDLSSFASDGVLTSTGISLGMNGEEDAQIDNYLDTNGRTESVVHENGDTASASAPSAAIWAERDQKLSKNHAENPTQTVATQSNQQLHEQLAQFHMQSPAIFAQLNGQKMNYSHQSTHPYQSTSAHPDSSLGHWENKSIAVRDEVSKRVSFGKYEVAKEVQKPYTFVQPLGTSAMPTPAQSGEMMPSMHSELVSPLPLGTGFENGDVPGEYSMNERGDILFTPLLSPAITQHGNSLHTSPQFAVEQHPSHSNGPAPTSSTDTQRRLESIQMQQMNLQRQLDELQQQQRQQQDQQSQPQMHQYVHQQQIYHQPQQRQAQQQDPTRMGSYVSPVVYPQTQNNFGSALSLTTGTPLQGPSPATSNNQDFFSPLGSPALGPVQHGAPVRKRHRSSLSNATSPASIHMSQLPQYPPSRIPEAGTVSPALLPQGALHVQRFMNMDGNSQAYLTEWAKLLSDNSSTSSSQISEASIPSPVHRKPAEVGAHAQYDGHMENHSLPTRQINARPSSTRSPALGPHRSGNGKTRPSPMIKPSQRPGRSNLGNGNSVTSSPLVVATNGTTCSPAIMSGGHLVDGFSNGSAGSGSLSPVDLSTILMPPPPPPPPQRTDGHLTKFAPITPAALMQIGAVGGLSALQESAHTPRAVHESTTSSHTRNSSQSYTQMSQSQSQTPKAEQATLPNVETIGSLDGTAKHQTPVGQSGLISAIALERLRAIKPGAKTTTFRPTTKASPLLQATKNGKSTKIANEANIPPEVRKSSHKQAEQRRRDSLKAGFDELRLLLPPINAEALDPETGEPIPGSSAPRLLPKSSLVPDSNPNKAVSKVALLKYSNEYIGRLNGKVERRDNYIDILKEAIRSCRHIAGFGPDEQLDELLDYAFEDEDEDEVPTGVAMAQELALQQDQDGSLQNSPEEMGEAVENQGDGPAASKRGRKNTGNSNNGSGTAATRGKRKPAAETAAAASTGTARPTGRKGRRGSTLSTVISENHDALIDVNEAREGGLVHAKHTNGFDALKSAQLLPGTDCDVDMVFDEGQRVQ